MPNTHIQEESHLKVLRLLAQQPEISQRELATKLNISLGKANYCLQALLDKGLIKIHNFASSRNKLGYAYLLTPAGVAAKSKLTHHFLQRKVAEYDALSHEIAQLEAEAGLENGVRPHFPKAEIAQQSHKPISESVAETITNKGSIPFKGPV